MVGAMADSGRRATSLVRILFRLVELLEFRGARYTNLLRLCSAMASWPRELLRTGVAFNAGDATGVRRGPRQEGKAARIAATLGRSSFSISELESGFQSNFDGRSGKKKRAA